MAFLGVFSVEIVIRRHDSPWIGLPDTDFKSLQVKLAERPFAHAGVAVETVGLLVVCCKMFCGSSYTLGLDPVNKCRSYLSAQYRIFLKILEVPAVERIPQQVHARAEDDVAPHVETLFPDGFPKSINQVLVPR